MIEISQLAKEYLVFRNRGALVKHAFGLSREGRDYDKVASLRSISLNVPKGQIHGIIGMNGAGKSTLLKILTGVILPTSGSFKLEGRVAALLELGTGFHSELTGRQNVYLNASIMGLSRSEVESKIEGIQSFSELGAFFDRPVKIYSSGMYVRLAFAFAVSVDPEVLIIDEALSVGDAYFQQKCLKKIESFKNQGTTILFVSHDLGAVQALCETVTLLDRGSVLFDGTPLQALDLYNDLLADFQSAEALKKKAEAAKLIEPSSSYESGSREFEIVKVQLMSRDGQEGLAFLSGEQVELCIEIKNIRGVDVSDLTCGLLIKDRLGTTVFGTNTYHLKTKLFPPKVGQQKKLSFSFQLNLGPGDYVLTLALHSDQSHLAKSYHWIERALLFKVLPGTDFSFIGLARLEPICKVEE